MPPQYWLNLQTRYDLEMTADLLETRLGKGVRTLKAQNAFGPHLIFRFYTLKEDYYGSITGKSE